MKRNVLILLLATLLFCSCEKDGDWYNRYSQERVYMKLEGGEFTITARCEIVYSGIYTVDDDGKMHYVYHDSYLVPDTSSYPYWVKTEVCEIEHISTKKMNITVFPTEQCQKIFIRLGGIDENGITHRIPDDGIFIYQGYPESQKLQN